MAVPNVLLEEMVKTHTDPSVRARLAAAIKGDVAKSIYCHSKSCKGAHIGDIHRDGKILSVSTKEDSGMLINRPRLDGELGFLCKCGNDSRLSKAEQGNFPENGAMPSNDQLNVIQERLAKSKGFTTTKGVRKIDGFSIQEVA